MILTGIYDLWNVNEIESCPLNHKFSDYTKQNQIDVNMIYFCVYYV